MALYKLQAIYVDTYACFQIYPTLTLQKIVPFFKHHDFILYGKVIYEKGQKQFSRCNFMHLLWCNLNKSKHIRCNAYFYLQVLGFVNVKEIKCMKSTLKYYIVYYVVDFFHPALKMREMTNTKYPNSFP